MTREIVQIGAPVLRMTAREIPLADIGSTPLTAIIADMKKLLAQEEYGVAIAAPQVGESLRMFVVANKALIEKKRTANKPAGETVLNEDYMKGLPSDEDEVYINPVLVRMSRGRKEKHEGCLSVRGKWGEVPRAEKCTIRAYNARGEKIERGASGFLAHIFQHEMDHLDGILYVDKAVDLYDEGDRE